MPGLPQVQDTSFKITITVRGRVSIHCMNYISFRKALCLSFCKVLRPFLRTINIGSLVLICARKSVGSPQLFQAFDLPLIRPPDCLYIEYHFEIREGQYSLANIAFTQSRSSILQNLLEDAVNEHASRRQGLFLYCCSVQERSSSLYRLS